MNKIITYGVPAIAIGAITLTSAPVLLVSGLAALIWGLGSHD